MPHIVIVSSSVRDGRASSRVAKYFKLFLDAGGQATSEIVDLRDYNFPVFNERLKFLKDLPPRALEFADKIKCANGVIIVTPEYNGGYPASLKNVIDFLYEEWHRKPIAISTVSDGSFGGTQVITSLQFSLWKIRAWVVPAMFPVPNVMQAFTEEGVPESKADMDKRAGRYISELMWCIEANNRMK